MALVMPLSEEYVEQTGGEEFEIGSNYVRGLAHF